MYIHIHINKYSEQLKGKVYMKHSETLQTNQQLIWVKIQKDLS